jgi:hypothetical protein
MASSFRLYVQHLVSVEVSFREKNRRGLQWSLISVPVRHVWRCRMGQLRARVERSNTDEKARLLVQGWFCCSQMLFQLLRSTGTSVSLSFSAHEEVHWKEIDVGLRAVCICGNSWGWCFGVHDGCDAFCRWFTAILVYSISKVLDIAPVRATFAEVDAESVCFNRESTMRMSSQCCSWDADIAIMSYYVAIDEV